MMNMKKGDKVTRRINEREKERDTANKERKGGKAKEMKRNVEERTEKEHEKCLDRSRLKK